MLSIASSPQVITGAQGQYLSACCQVTSTESLVGQPICVNPALFANSAAQLPINNTNQYKLLYPSSGTVQMDSFGSAVNENHAVSIEYINDKNFIVCIDFFVLNDIGGYISDVSQNNFTALNPLNITSGFLNLFIEAGGESVLCSQPIELTPFCQDDVTFTTPFSDGYCIGENLDITINIPVGLGLSNNLFAGFVRHNSVSNGLGFVQDLSLIHI